MDAFSINTIAVILLYVPGYLFVHVRDYFLLKREKSQFEITVQGLLASVCIIFFYLCWPYQFYNNEKEIIFNGLIEVFSSTETDRIKIFVLENLRTIGLLYFLLCVYACFISAIIAIIRRSKWISWVFEHITKRDFFERVNLRFYSETCNETVLITMKDGIRYLGYLIGAPDNEQEGYLILQNPFVIEKGQLQELNANRILLKEENIISIEAQIKENGNE